jgi:predicted solute-binding protein
MKAKSISCLTHLYAEPLMGKRESSFVWSADVATRNALGVRERRLDGAFLTPIDYARDSSLLNIVPKVAVSSVSGDGTITLHFRENLHSISTLAVDPSSVSEIVLARILLAEQFDCRPALVPVSGGPEEGLTKADAMLCVGDAAMRARGRSENVLDLVEEWMELTDLPYVHGFWCGYEGSLDANDIRALQQSCADGLGMLGMITAAAVARHGLKGIPPLELQRYLEGLSYELMEDEKAGVQEFFRYAFYHGVLPDIAELQFYGRSSGDVADGSDTDDGAGSVR